MEAAQRFWQSLSDNAVLLMVVMPVVGAVLVRFMRRSGSEPVYFTGLVNVWLTAGLATIMVIAFEPASLDTSPFETKISSSIHWIADWTPPPPSATGESVPTATWTFSGLNVRFAVGANRLNLWFLVLTVVTSLAAAHTLSQDDPRLVSKLSWMLLTEAALLGALAAQDVILLAMCAQVSTLGVFFLLGQGGDPARREAARRFFRTQTLSGFLLLVGLTGAAISHWWMQATVVSEESPRSPRLTFNLTRIVDEAPELAFTTDAAHELWTAVSPWLFVAMCGALLLRLPMPPFHHWWYRVNEHADSRTLALFAAGYLPLSFYGAARIVVPLFPELVSEMAPRVFLWGQWSAILLGFATLVIDRPRRLAATAAIIGLTIAFGAVFFGDDSTITGGMLLTLGVCSSLSMLSLVSEPVTQASTPRTVAVALVVGSAGLAVLPLSASFWGEIQILDAVFRRDSSAAFWLIIATMCVGISMTKQLAKALRDRPLADADTRTIAGSRVSLLAFAPLLALLLCGGLMPEWITGPFDTSPLEDNSAAAESSPRQTSHKETTTPMADSLASRTAGSE